MERDHLVPCRDDAATASELVVRIQRLERIVEQIVGVLVAQIMKGDVDGSQQNSVVEQIGGAPAPQTWEPIGEGVLLAPQERLQNRTLEQTTEFPVPQILEAVVDVVPSTPQECVQNRTLEQTTEFPVPQIWEAVLEVLPSTPQVRVQHRTQEQIMDFPMPRNMEAVVEVGRVNHMNACRIVFGSRSWICQCP